MQNWNNQPSIMSHKLRSFLTMVGIVIERSVVVIMALGDGMKVVLPVHHDQEYTNLSYSPNKSGYVTGTHVPEEQEKAEAKVALQLKIEDGCPIRYRRRKMLKILMVKSKKTNSCARILTGINQDSQSMAIM